jgi:hypothetical protein
MEDVKAQLKQAQQLLELQEDQLTLLRREK